jgi:xylulokinase
MLLLGGVALNNDLVLGIDVGTSSVKVLYISLTGNFFYKDEEKIGTHRAGVNAEQIAEDYLSVIQKITKRNTDLNNKVVSVGLSGQTPSLVCIDASGKSTFPVLIWQDNRATEEAAELASVFGNPLTKIGTSLPWSASGCLAKLFWIHQHQRAVQSNTTWILQPKDFVGFHLTGEVVSDPWSSKGLCNVLNWQVPETLFAHIGWSQSVVPTIKAGEDTRGVISQSGSDWSGLPAGIPVTVGWSDAMSGMNSLGVMSKPTSFIITGTSAIVGSSTTAEIDDAGSLYVIPKSCAPMTIIYGPTQSSGSAIAWAAALFGRSESEIIQAGSQNTSPKVPIYLPYISGERAPLWRNDIRGGFFEIDQSDDFGAFARSIMEGISFAEKQVLELAYKITGEAKDQVCLGGHAGNDKRWEETRTRTLGSNILRYEDEDTTTRGAAMLALNLVVGNFREAYEALRVSPSVVNRSSEDLDYASINYQRFLLAQQNLIAYTDRKDQGVTNNVD